MRGGYQIIDLKGTNFITEITSYPIRGIYDLIEGTTKPLLISNFKLNSVDKHDFFAEAVVVGDTFEVKTNITGITKIIIKHNDTIIFKAT